MGFEKFIGRDSTADFFYSQFFVSMPDSLGMKVVNRVAKADRLPFIKALAYIALADDSVTIDEKQMIRQYADAWNLGEDVRSDLQETLRSGQTEPLDALVAGFSESGTRFLLVQELMRLSHADGTYGDAERRETAMIAKRLGMDEDQFREVEKWVGRGEAWRRPSEDDEAVEDELEDVLSQEADDEYDLSDIKTGETDLSDIDPGGYEVDGEEDEPTDDS
jgi:uncharacterized tellurite resistance protein B-like protein